jgi:hypothetical protein
VTRIPQLEQELVAAAERLQSPRRLVWPAARAALAAAVVAAVLAVVLAIDDDTHRRAQPAGGPPVSPNRNKVDPEAGVSFNLDGRVLTVTLLASAPGKTRDMVSDMRVRATCGKGFTEGPGPGPGPNLRQTRTRVWPAGSERVSFRFPEDISRIATWCRLEDPVAGHVAFVKFGAAVPAAALPPKQEVERIANKWARLFAASDPAACDRYMAQPACERIDCVRISGPIRNCTPLSPAVRKSFADATVQDVAVRGGDEAAVKFSNGQAIELYGGMDEHLQPHDWLIVKVGGNAR